MAARVRSWPELPQSWQTAAPCLRFVKLTDAFVIAKAKRNPNENRNKNKKQIKAYGAANGNNCKLI